MLNEHSLYIAIATGLAFNDDVTFKIGITNNIKKRAAAIQNGCPAELGFVFVGITSKSDAANVETNLKQMLKAFQTSGGTEWFSMSDSDFDRFLTHCKNTFSIEERRIHPLFQENDNMHNNTPKANVHMESQRKAQFVDVPVLGESGHIESMVKVKSTLFKPFSAPLG